MKKILFVLFAVVIALSSLAMYVSADEDGTDESQLSEAVSETSEAVSETAEESSEEVSEESEESEEGDDFIFKGFGEDGFMRNIKYMGLGMLGIFAVVGVVILITFVLNSATSKK